MTEIINKSHELQDALRAVNAVVWTADEMYAIINDLCETAKIQVNLAGAYEENQAANDYWEAIADGLQNVKDLIVEPS